MSAGRAVLIVALAVCAARGSANSGGYLPPSSDPQHLQVIGEHTYFTADDGIHGRELWRIDAAGRAELVLDITPGAEGSAISNLSPYLDVLLFRLDPPDDRSELWRTDGTPAGTERLIRFGAGTGEKFDTVMAITPSGAAYLRTLREVACFWTMDEPRGSARRLELSVDNAYLIMDHGGAVFRDHFYFAATHIALGPGLFRYRKSAEAAEPIAYRPHMPQFLTVLSPDQLIFRSSDGKHGVELHISDGSIPGTRMLVDIAPGEASSNPDEFRAAAMPDGTPVLFFTADDGVHGREPWVTDGTPEGTRMIADLYPGRVGGSPYSFTVSGDTVSFVGTSQGGGKEIWWSRYPFESAELLADIYPGPLGSDPYALCAFGDDQLAFSAFNPDTGEELYVAAPSRREVKLVRDIYPGAESSYPYYTIAAGDRVQFVATDPVRGRELWQLDETGEAKLLADLYADGSANPSSSPRELTPLGALLYFVANDIAHGSELWVTDGERTGTRLVKDIFPGPASSDPRELTPAGDFLYFTAEDGQNGYRLWRSDGTDDGTLLASLEAEFPRDLTASGAVLYFSAERAGEGRELWRAEPDTDPALVRDIAPGAASSNPRSFTAHGEYVYFLADDGIHGEELWRSNGTPEGTILVRDLAPAPFEPVRVGSLVSSDSGLYLVARSGALGEELWRLNEDPVFISPVRDIARGDWIGTRVLKWVRPPVAAKN